MPNINILLTIFAMVEAIQVLIVAAFIYSFIPIHWAQPIPKGLEPERESFLYFIFIAAAIGIVCASLKWIKPRLEQSQFRRAFIYFLCLEGWWIFWELFSFFKWITYKYPFYNILPYEDGSWVLPFFDVVLAGWLLSKIFWPECLRFAKKFGAYVLPRSYHVFVDIAVSAFIILSLCLIRIQDALALNFVWDQMNRLDQWSNAVHMGYGQVIVLFIAMACCLMIGFYLFLRRWLKSIAIAVFATLVVMNMQLFHSGLAPMWLIPPSWQADLYVLGFDNWPMFKALQVRQFFPFFMGYLVPICFVLTVLLNIPHWSQSRDRRIASSIAIAGLGIFVFYIFRPAIGAYGMVAMPLLAVLSFWIKELAQVFAPSVHRIILIALVIIAAVMLMTNRLFVVYPNAFHAFNDRFANERKFYEAVFQFKPDASLIEQLTRPQERVALLSSFEMEILNEAHRQPLLPHAPIMTSVLPMNPNVAGLKLKLRQQALDVFNAIEGDKPSIIFMEKKIWGLTQFSPDTGFGIVLNKIHELYVPMQEGQFLIALKRKE